MAAQGAQSLFNFANELFTDTVSTLTRLASRSRSRSRREPRSRTRDDGPEEGLSSDVQEVTLPSDGVYGLLNDEQQLALRAFWGEFFKVRTQFLSPPRIIVIRAKAPTQLVDQAPEEGPLEPQAGVKATVNVEATDVDNMPMPRRAARNDTERDRQRRLQESNDARACLSLYGRRAFLDAFWRYVGMDYPDSIVLKFLRARKWNVPASLAMLVSCIKWRLESDIEEIVRLGEGGWKQEGFSELFEKGLEYTHGTDKQGRPVCWIDINRHKHSKKAERAVEDYLGHQMEWWRAKCIPPNDKMTIVADMTGTTLANFDLKPFACMDTLYPEILNVVLIHNAPTLFWGSWKMIKLFLDPIVRRKVQFTYRLEDLTEHIDKSHIPMTFGGEDAFEWRYSKPDIAVVDPNELEETAKVVEDLKTERQALITEFSRITRLWVPAPPTDLDYPDVILSRRVLQSQMRLQALELDPYVRARTIQHRMGYVLGNGMTVERHLRAGEEKWDVRGWEHCMEWLEEEVKEGVRLLEARGSQWTLRGLRVRESEPDEEWRERAGRRVQEAKGLMRRLEGGETETETEA